MEETLVLVAMVSTQNPWGWRSHLCLLKHRLPSGLLQEEGPGWTGSDLYLCLLGARLCLQPDGRLIDYAIVSLPAENREWKIKYDREEGGTACIIVTELRQILRRGDLYLVRNTLIALCVNVYDKCHWKKEQKHKPRSAEEPHKVLQDAYSNLMQILVSCF